VLGVLVADQKTGFEARCIGGDVYIPQDVIYPRKLRLNPHPGDGGFKGKNIIHGNLVSGQKKTFSGLNSGKKAYSNEVGNIRQSIDGRNTFYDTKCLLKS
jgi:hypothetical protein